ncbi:MAG TPA: hypothetical protein VH637_23295 [Streptosporangiaceae bacterium]|jgi:hypothetical protein
MCDDQKARTFPVSAAPGGMSRRGFMHATAATAAAAAVLKRMPRLPLRSAAREVTADGTAAYSMAMHVHSSFSEQSGSMDGQLFQAAKNSVDVLWWTDHDHMMDGIGYRKTVHFTSLTAESGGPGERGPWKWTTAKSGPVASTSGGGIVQSPSSPGDPVAGGSMHLTAKSTTTATAKYGFYADSHPAGWNYHDNINGQSLTIDVLLTSGWSRGYLELLIATSYHPAAGGRPAGAYTLSYRFVHQGAAASRVANGIQAIITIPVKPASAQNPWGSVTVTPAADIAALWPDLDHRDFALWGLTLSAVSTGDQAEGYFDYLRFTRQISGEAFLKQQMDMETVLAPRYPAVAQRQGLEVSWLLPHMNWFGGAVVTPDYGKTTSKTYSAYLQHTMVPQVHAAGGLVSYNHPYGYGDPAQLPAAQQDALLAQVAGKLLPTATAPAALGADLLEVGYPLRQGVNLAHHVALWDVMSRNAVFLTGNGTNDDHFGQNWSGIHNNWFTSVWAASTAEASLLASLAAGRAWCASLSSYRGSLDLLVDGTSPMGSVSVARVPSRQLLASATKIPANGSLQILQGTVDYAGTAALSANTKVVGTYPASALGSGSVQQSIDTSKDTFVRTQVLNSSGAVVGLSNPVWLLRAAPPGGIPAPRAA